jgi:hypothetical protein
VPRALRKYPVSNSDRDRLQDFNKARLLVLILAKNIYTFDPNLVAPLGFKPRTKTYTLILHINAVVSLTFPMNLLLWTGLKFETFALIPFWVINKTHFNWKIIT